MKEPTRSTCTLDLALSSQPQLVLGSYSYLIAMSDHEAVNFQLSVSVKRLPTNIIKLIEKVLRRKWKDTKKFLPIVTCMS